MKIAMSKMHKSMRRIAGIVGMLLLNLSFAAVCILCHSVSVLFNLLLMHIGFSQFIYAVPLLTWLVRTKRGTTAQGVWIAMGLTALANAGYQLYWVLRR
jgi:Zn-dependent membrane protease YugP